MRNRGAFKLANPWALIAWLLAFGLLSVSFVLGFAVLSGYQQDERTLGIWAAICHGLGIVADVAPSEEPKPPLWTPTNVAWTVDTLHHIASGDASHGQFIAINCVACHGERGVSTSSLVPTLAGMDAAVIYKQLADYRSGKRLWGVMSAIAQALSADDFADVAVYFAVQPDGLAPLHGDRIPEAGRSLRESDPARRLVFAGDPQRAIPPCAACHGPGGFKTGVPALHGQLAEYIERQLGSFAEGIRHNDIYEQMRAIAKELTPDEMHAVAAYYAEKASNELGRGNQ